MQSRTLKRMSWWLCWGLIGMGEAASAAEISPTAEAFPVEKLPPGYVRGDVVSYSYVPNRTWGRAEAMGVCPYLFEYALLQIDDKWYSLEKGHVENIRRIDMVSQWSTVVSLSHRHEYFRQEFINLMIRAFAKRQLMIVSAWEEDPDQPHKIIGGLLEQLWADRDKTLTNPEGDQATGRQLINNILAVSIGDEELAAIKTEGLEKRIQTFKEQIQNRRIDGQRPFAHIKCWFNEIHYAIGAYAANPEDLEKGRHKWPSNCEFIGVDTYHFWGFDHTPFDPDDPNVSAQQIIDHALSWQNVVTRYYGRDFRVRLGEVWKPEHHNDTHAMMQGIDLGGADRAMMIYIANSCAVHERSYTTPIETMDAFYDSIKAGPWVGLSWWIFGGYVEFTATLDYMDKTLKRYTPQHPKGVAYSEAELEKYRRRFLESRMRMFNDVVYNQFGHLNGPKPKS